MVKELSDQDICAFTRSVTQEEAQNYLESAEPEAVTGSNATTDFGPLSLLFVINTSDEEKTVDITGSETAKNYQVLSYQLNTGETESSLADGKLTIPAYGVAVLTSMLGDN